MRLITFKTPVAAALVIAGWMLCAPASEFTLPSDTTGATNALSFGGARLGQLSMDTDSLFSAPPLDGRFPGANLNTLNTYEARYALSPTLSLVSGGQVYSARQYSTGATATEIPALFGLAWEPLANSNLRPIIGFSAGGIYTNSVSGGHTGWGVGSAREFSAGFRYHLSDNSIFGVTGSLLEIPSQNSVLQRILLGYTFKF